MQSSKFFLLTLKLAGADESHRVRNRTALNSKLKGSTLGASNRDDSLDAKNWIKKQKKRAKERERELAERRQREMDESDRAAAYDEGMFFRPVYVHYLYI